MSLRSFPLSHALYSTVLVLHIIESYTENVQGMQNLKREERLQDGDRTWLGWCAMLETLEATIRHGCWRGQFQLHSIMRQMSHYSIPS